MNYLQHHQAPFGDNYCVILHQRIPNTGYEYGVFRIQKDLASLLPLFTVLQSNDQVYMTDHKQHQDVAVNHFQGCHKPGHCTHRLRTK